jgi:hypothetical protein
MYRDDQYGQTKVEAKSSHLFRGENSTYKYAKDGGFRMQQEKLMIEIKVDFQSMFRVY